MTKPKLQSVEKLPAPVVSDERSVMEIISRVAADPMVSVDRLERLTDLYERISRNKAKAEFDTSLAEMQPNLPVVGRRGRITITDRTNREKVLQSTPYALFEDINKVCIPVMAKYGFAISFRTGMAQDGKITITGILSHKGGHREETTITLPHDATGSKNAVQAVGSSTSYGKRYVMTSLLNITTEGEDDDGKIAGDPIIDADQATTIADMIEASGADLKKVLKTFSIESIEQLPARLYDDAIERLKLYANKKKAADAALKEGGQ